MKTTSAAHLVDAFSPYAPATEAPHLTATLATMVRAAVHRAERMVCGTDAETARAAYLAEAVDQADLERRSAVWERAQAAYRSLPPAL